MTHALQTAQAAALLENVPLGLVLFQKNGKIAWVNKWLLDKMGAGATAVTGLDELQLTAQYLRPSELGSRYYMAGDDPSAALLQLQSREFPLEGWDGSVWLLTDDTALAALNADNRQLRQQLERNETRDGLTGLMNRRSLMQALEAQVSRSRRYGNPLSVMSMQVVSVDSLTKGVTPVTDQVLLAISYFLRDQLRWVDLIGRTGDQEFLLVLPETDAADAKRLGDKINERLSSVSLPEAQGVKVDVSVDMRVAQWGKGDDMTRLMSKLEAG